MKFGKKLLPIIGILVLFVAIVAGAYVFVTPTQQSVLQQPEYIQIPLFGFLSCERDGTLNKGPFTLPVTEDGFEITCGGLGLWDNCDITLRAPDKTVIGLATYKYRVCSRQTGTCGSESSVHGGIGGFSGEIASVKINSDELVIARYTENGIDKAEATYSYRGVVYALRVFDNARSDNGQLISVPGSCRLDDDYLESRGVTGGNLNKFTLNQEGIDVTNAQLNNKGAVYTYLSRFSPMPAADQAFLQQEDGALVYCERGTHNLYEIIDVETRGANYKVVNIDPSGVVGNVVCCDGERLPTQVCEDGQWVDIGTEQCNVFNPCDTIWRGIGDSTAQRFNCVEGQCVAETKKVACWLDSDCSGSEACFRNTADPSQNECVRGGGVGTGGTGDLTCDISGKIFNPDCGGGGDKLLFSFIAGLAAALALFAIFRNSKVLGGKKNDFSNAMLSLVLGLAVGAVFFIFFTEIIIVAIIAAVALIIMKVVL